MDAKSDLIADKLNEACLPPIQSQPIPATLATQIAYDEIMNTLQSDQEDQLLQQTISKLSKQYILYDPKRKGMGLHISVTGYTLNWQAMILEIQYGPLIASLNILNLSEKSKHHGLTCCYSGNFGTTYKCDLPSRDVAIKCLPIHDFQQDLRFLLKEYLLLLVASCLKSGPSIDNIYGYHILVYPDCIEFCMEFCDHRLPRVTQLFSALKRLHLLGIMHCDIKPNNVCYSNVFQNPVFIDFGLSVLVGQARGQLTRTHFKGSPEYCSPQMKDCYIESSARMVDLYYNDAHALRKTIDKIEEIELSRIKIDNKNEEEGVSSGLGRLLFEQNIVLLCKFYLFFSHFKRNRLELSNLFNNMGYRLAIIRPSLLNFIDCLQSKFQFEEIALLSRGSREMERQNYRFAKQLHLYRQGNIGIEEDGFKMRYRDIQENIFEEEFQQAVILKLKILLNYEQSQKCEMEIYLLSVAEVIQVNSFAEDFNTKWNICKIMKRLYLHQRPNVKADIGECLIFMFEYAASKPTTKRTVILLTRILLSIIILELKTQKQLVSILEKVHRENIELSYLLKLILSFVTSLKWIQAKYKTSYKLVSLQANIVSFGEQAITKILQRNMNKIDIFLCNCLLFVLRQRKQPLKVHEIIQKRRQMIKILHHLNQSEFKLIEQIEIYLLFTLCEFCYQSQQQEIVHNKIIHSLERYVQKYNKTSFEYYHFLIYKYYQSQKRNSVAEILNKNLRALLQPFHNSNVYKIEVQQHFQLFRMRQLSYHEFMAYIIEIGSLCNQDYRIYIADYFTLMLSTSPYVFEQSQAINRLTEMTEEETTNNRYKKELQYCKSVLDQYIFKERTGKHQHTLIEEISILKKIFVLYYCKKAVFEYNEQILKQFFSKIKAIFEKIDCFQCKAFSLFEIIPVRIININSTLSQLQQLWNLYLDSLIFCLHQRKTRYFVMYFATLLISLYLQRPLQFMHYNPFLLYHYCVKTLNAYSQYLLQLSQKMFTYMYNYLYLTNDTSQLYLFIYQLLLLLKERISHIFSTKFYNYVKYFIKSVMNNPFERQNVFEKHTDIVAQLIKGNNEYVGLYFNAFLPSIIGKNRGKALILKICYSLNSLDPQSKQLILRSFNKHLITLLSPSRRQRSFWQRKHLKYTNNKSTIRLIIKSSHQQYKTYLTKAVKLYHQNAGSVK